MAADGLLSGTGYERIDHLDYRDWLTRHGAARETIDSPIVRGMYDLTFAYQGGDRATPRFAAGLGLQLAFRMLFDFKGSIFWRMQAGMGEIIFAPLYEALPVAVSIPLLPSPGPPAAHRWPGHLIDRPEPSGESEAGTRPLRAAGPSP